MHVTSTKRTFIICKQRCLPRMLSLGFFSDIVLQHDQYHCLKDIQQKPVATHQFLQMIALLLKRVLWPKGSNLVGSNKGWKLPFTISLQTKGQSIMGVRYAGTSIIWMHIYLPWLFQRQSATRSGRAPKKRLNIHILK